jgi:hypothetical protein
LFHQSDNSLEDLHATLRSRFEADQRAAPDRRVLPRGIFETPPMPSAAAALHYESAITDVEAALTRIISQLDQLSSQANAEQLVSSLLKKFDGVTGLSAWSDPKHTH